MKCGRCGHEVMEDYAGGQAAVFTGFWLWDPIHRRDTKEWDSCDQSCCPYDKRTDVPALMLYPMGSMGEEVEMPRPVCPTEFPF